jgi:hypothetical protein
VVKQCLRADAELKKFLELLHCPFCLSETPATLLTFGRVTKTLQEVLMEIIITKRYKFVDGVLAEKQCSRCESWKPIDRFLKDNRKKYGLGSHCYACKYEKSKEWVERNREKLNTYARSRKKNNPRKPISPAKRRAEGLKINYGLSVNDYNEMHRKQNGVCAICKSDNRGKRLVVDHDHKTGEVRGLLCSSCNWALGHMKDDIGILEKAIDYLKRMFEKQKRRPYED